MKIKPGYLYHIKDEFFKVVDDDKLMKNKPNGGGRPTLICAVEGSEFFWAVPISSQTDKYIKLLKQKREKFKNPLNVVIGIYNYKDLDLTNRDYQVTQTNISKMMTVVEPRPYSEHITKKYVAYMKAQEKEKAQEQARKKQEFKKEVEKNKNYKIKVTEVEYD